MQRSVLAVLMSAALGAPASAQVVSDSQFASELGKALAQSVSSGQDLSKSMEQKGLSRALERVMVAMYDAPGTGESIVQWLRDHNAAVEFSDITMEKRSSHAWLGDFVPEPRKPAVYITPLLLKPPLSYRLLGTLVAQEASELMLEKFPESAEKRYIVLARMAETYFELGGTRIALPDFDGTIDEDAASKIQVWIENAPEQGVKVLRGQGHKTLRDLQGELLAEQSRLQALLAAIDQRLSVPSGYEADYEAEKAQALEQIDLAAKKLDAAKKAEAEFKAFQRYETEWLMSHRPS